MPLLSRAVLSCAVVLCASTSGATVADPVVILRAEAPRDALVDGQEFEIPVDIYVREDRAIEEVRLRSDLSMAALRFEPALGRRAPAEAPGYRHEHRILRGRLDPGLDRVRLQVIVEGEVYEEAIHLRDFGDRVAENTEISLARGIDDVRLDPAGFSRPEPSSSGFPKAAEVDLSKAARPVTVTGRITMSMGGDGQIRGVDGATVLFMQVRGVLDDLELGGTTTDVNGDFTIDTSVDGTPDVYVKVRAENGAANIGTDLFFGTYSRNLPTIQDFAASTLDVGTRRFYDDMNHALWLLTNFTRAQRWMEVLSFDIPRVNCRWIDDVIQSSCYSPIAGLEGIHLRSSATWSGSTVLHEYGHHIVNSTSINQVSPPYYLNGICDPSHCGACPENEAVAWSEGFPSFVQQEFAYFHRAVYGWDVPSAEFYETVGTCGETGNFGESAQRTEDFLSALLNDLIDSAADASPWVSGLVEHSELTLQDILTVASTHDFSSSVDFVTSMRDYLSGPQFTDEDRFEFWAATAVNGFAWDFVPPTTPSISVPTHPIGVESFSATPSIFFSGATDEHSGVVGYRVEIQGSIATPGAGAPTFDTDSFAWPTLLTEGTYYINFVSLDRAGNESAASSYGPILVGPQGQVDLRLHRPNFWEDELLLRHDTSVTAAAGAIEPLLVPNQDLWISLSTINGTPFAQPVDEFRHRIGLNGDTLLYGNFDPGTMSPAQRFQILNAGPVQLRGGRYRLHIGLDRDGTVPESDEENRFDRAFVVQPDLLTPGPWSSPYPAPPVPFTPGDSNVQRYPNAAGHRFVPEHDFSAFLMATESSTSDYSLRLHPPSTGVDNGFEIPLASSSRPAGEIEVLVVNRSALGQSTLDVGVVRETRGVAAGYSIRHRSSVLAAPGDDTLVAWSNGDVLSLIEYDFAPADAGPFTIEVEATFSELDTQRAIELFWIDRNRSVTNPQSASPSATLSGNERATIEVDVPGSGSYCLAVFRDIRSGQVAPPATISISTDTTPLPDLAIFRDAEFWDLPFVPSFEPLLGPKGPLPTQLVGGLATYLNYTYHNTGQLAAQFVVLRAGLDGIIGPMFYDQTLDVINPQESVMFFDSTPVFVPGGRHTITLQLDPFDQVLERDETNNSFAMQFGWAGQNLEPSSNAIFAAPPDPEADRELVEIFLSATGPDGEEPVELPSNPWHPNSDGYHLAAILQKAGEGNWAAVATMPGANSDVDPRLHEVMPPADAFGLALATSTWGPGESDFVLIERAAAGTGPFDVSVVNAGGEEPYSLAHVLSDELGTVGEGSNSFGSFALDNEDFLDLHDTVLQPGAYQITLTPVTGNADLGLSVFFPSLGAGSAFRSKDEGRERSPMSYDAPAAAPETVHFDVRPGEEGRFCFAVWKVASADMPANAFYSLDIEYVAAAPECIRIDGLADGAYDEPLSIQTVQTQFGDAQNGDVALSEGSELDQLFASICDGTLHVMLTGNLESNYNDLELFIDSRPGGQNRLLGNNARFGEQNDPNRMGDDGSGNGFTFEPGFEADWWFTVEGGFGESVGGFPYRLAAYRVELLTNGGGPGTSLGFTGAGTRGLLREPGSGALASDVRIAIDNSNTAGVGPGTGPASGAGVLTGIEFSIPLSEIGDPSGCVRLVAFINGKQHDFVSNQFLPPLPVGTSFLEDPRTVDLGSFAGDQSVEVCAGTVTAVEDDTPSLAVRRVSLEAPAPNPFNPRTRIAFRLPRATTVELTLFDVAGRRVRTLIGTTSMNVGLHELVWEGLDDNGRRVASGAYLLRLRADGEEHVRRLTLLK